MDSNRRLNYGFDKSHFDPDKTRINWDYIKGIIDTDGCIQNKRKGDYRVVICQSHPKYLKVLKAFIEKEKDIFGSTYMNETQISFSNKEFLNFVLTYKIDNYNSYYAGIIDGDGSFCSHKSSSGVYWRFCLGASKERKIKIFKDLFDYFQFEPVIWENKKTKCKMFAIQKVDELIYLLEKIKKFAIQKVDELIYLLEKIKNNVIVKQFVVDKVLDELKNRKKSLKQQCIFCGLEFERKLIKGHNLKKICDRRECRKRYNRERMREYRFKDKQKQDIDKGENTQKFNFIGKE